MDICYLYPSAARELLTRCYFSERSLSYRLNAALNILAGSIECRVKATADLFSPGKQFHVFVSRSRNFKPSNKCKPSNCVKLLANIVTQWLDSVSFRIVMKILKDAT